jgi:hypothetical protein
MDIPEIEVMPGVYITDYRKSSTKKDLKEIQPNPTAEEYRKEILEKSLLDPLHLADERRRYEIAIQKLQDSNKDLLEENDPELLEAVNENSHLIGKYQDIIKVLEEFLGETGSVYL